MFNVSIKQSIVGLLGGLCNRPTIEQGINTAIKQ